MAEFITNCPHCNAELQAQNEWIGMELECPSCQSKFLLQGNVPLPAGVALEENALGEKSCPFCGGTIKVQAIFCKHCKTDLKSAPVPQLQTQVESRFIFICPECNTVTELTESMKDKEYECPSCCESSVAREAVERNCPLCGEKIKIKATVCKYCRKNVPPLLAPPLEPIHSKGYEQGFGAALEDTNKLIRSGVNAAKKYFLANKRTSLWILGLVFLSVLVPVVTIISVAAVKSNSGSYRTSDTVSVSVTVKKWFIGTGESWKYGCEYKLYANDRLVASRDSRDMSVTFHVDVKKGAVFRAEMYAKNGFGGTKLYEGPKYGSHKAINSGDSITIECW